VESVVTTPSPGRRNVSAVSSTSSSGRPGIRVRLDEFSGQMGRVNGPSATADVLEKVAVAP
jgi:hypothetical protein